MRVKVHMRVFAGQNGRLVPRRRLRPAGLSSGAQVLTVDKKAAMNLTFCVCRSNMALSRSSGPLARLLP